LFTFEGTLDGCCNQPLSCQYLHAVCCTHSLICRLALQYNITNFSIANSYNFALKLSGTTRNVHSLNLSGFSLLLELILSFCAPHLNDYNSNLNITVAVYAHITALRMLSYSSTAFFKSHLVTPYVYIGSVLVFTCGSDLCYNNTCTIHVYIITCHAIFLGC